MISALETPSRRWRLWFCAAGAPWRFMPDASSRCRWTSSDDVSDDLGAQAYEVGIDFTAPKVDETDLPVGREADASVAAPDIMEQRVERRYGSAERASGGQRPSRSPRFAPGPENA